MNAATVFNSDQTLILGVNVLLQVTLLATVALAISLASRRNPAFRYWVLCSALMLVLLSPCVALLMQLSGRGLITISHLKGPHHDSVTTVAPSAGAGAPPQTGSRSPQ